MSEDGLALDLPRLLEVLDRHRVNYLVVGGVGAQIHGAQRPTEDLDCLPDLSDQNLDRLAAALRELNARLRVPGMSDEEAKQLPFRLDRQTLRGSVISNLMTDAGPIDVLHQMPDRDGHAQSYEQLIARSSQYRTDTITVRVAQLSDIIASKEHADRDKDREALPELRSLAHRQRSNPANQPQYQRPPDRPKPGGTW